MWWRNQGETVSPSTGLVGDVWGADEASNAEGAALERNSMQQIEPLLLFPRCVIFSASLWFTRPELISVSRGSGRSHRAQMPRCISHVLQQVSTKLFSSNQTRRILLIILGCTWLCCWAAETTDEALWIIHRQDNSTTALFQTQPQSDLQKWITLFESQRDSEFDMCCIHAARDHFELA